MAIDTPARLAILGAGPIGLEAALYARFLGYDVVIFDSGDVAASVRHWGHVRMFTPYGMNRTTLGLAAIQAQDESYQPPPADALLTGQEWLDQYLLPLAATDLVSDHLRLNTTVIAIGKEELLQHERPQGADRGDWPFRVLSRTATGQEQIESFDGILDCTGVFTNPNWLGHGGIPAIGEIALRDEIEYRLPDILGKDRPRYAGKHTLLIGAGMSAATNIGALADIATTDPQTRISWITRREGPAAGGGPVPLIENDPLPPRRALAEQANQLAHSSHAVTCLPSTVVERITAHPENNTFDVDLSGDHARTIQADQIIANVGFHRRMLIADLQPLTSSVPSPITSEPNFYILGAKTHGHRSDFPRTTAYLEIRTIFKIIGDREGLDLYSTTKPLLK